MNESPYATSQVRRLYEPGLPTFYQEIASRTWDTALPIPTLSNWRRGLDTRRPVEFPFGDLDRSEVHVHVLTRNGWPTGMQMLNCHWFPAMDQEFTDVLVQGILDHYPGIRLSYSHLPEEDRARCLPESPDLATLHRLVRLQYLVLHAVPSATPYVGASFDCAWDEEHGLGVLTCGTELLAVGNSDDAFDDERAQEHRRMLLGG